MTPAEFLVEFTAVAERLIAALERFDLALKRLEEHLKDRDKPW